MQACPSFHYDDTIRSLLDAKTDCCCYNGQRDLVGKGYTGPPVVLDNIQLTDVQRDVCMRGFNEQQLRMLKAQVLI